MRASLGCATALAVTLGLSSIGGCATGGGGEDAGGGGVDSGPGGVDAGRRDAGSVGLPDAGPPPMDAGPGADAGPPFDAGPDGGPGMDSGGLVDSGPGGGCPADDPTITISEIMVSSQSGSGDRGEWFEIRNEASCTVDLTGLEIRVGAASHTITSGLLTAGGYFLLAQSMDTMENHDLTPDYVYGTGVSFPNIGGTLSLRSGMNEVARVSWGSTDYRRGASRQLSRSASETEPLGDSSWCDSTNVYSMASGGPYLGTPGMRNEVCP